MTDLMTLAPRRIQRRRTKGWRMPPNCVYVGRPSCWGNPFAVSGASRAGQALAVWGFRDEVQKALIREETPQWVHEKWNSWGTDEPLADPLDWLGPLRGRNLACWCPLTYSDGTPCPCHADVLLEVANA